MAFFSAVCNSYKALPNAFLMYFMFLTTQNENKFYLLKLLILKDPTVSFIFLINVCLFSYNFDASSNSDF